MSRATLHGMTSGDRLMAIGAVSVALVFIVLAIAEAVTDAARANALKACVEHHPVADCEVLR